MAGAGTWAGRRTGEDSGDDAGSDSGDSEGSSVSSASSDSYEDDKFHLPADHRPFVLLPGWDQPPPPPPKPEVPSGSSSSGGESGSEEEGESGSGGESSSESEDGQQPPAPAPREPGFACQDCAFFKALGNGTFGCENENYERWAGTDRLVETKSGRAVLNPLKACSDWFEPATGAGAKPIKTRHNPDKGA